jgi:transposase
MRTIPTSVTQEAFDAYIRPVLTTAKRGFVSKIPLYKIFNLILYQLHTGCQWHQLPVEKEGVKISWQAIYHHFRKWSVDGSLERLFTHSIELVRDKIDVFNVNLDGSHTIAKKGGEKVAYQGRKKAKTSNILPLTDANGIVLASTKLVAGNHHDAYELRETLSSTFKSLKRLGIQLSGSYLNADMAFDTKAARKICFNYGVIPNIPENTRSRKRVKRGRKRLFKPAIYKKRFVSERTFSWIDKFRGLLVRFERKAAHFLAKHHLAYALINLRLLWLRKV